MAAATVSSSRTGKAQIAFVRRASADHESYDVLVDSLSSALPAIDTPPLSADSPAPREALLRLLRAEMLLPDSWAKAAADAAYYHPTGHDTSSVSSPEGPALQHTWVIDVSRVDSAALPRARDTPAANYEWTDSSHLQGSSELHPIILHQISQPLLSSTVTVPSAIPIASVETDDQLALPDSRFPWRVEPSGEMPPPPPVRHIRRLRNRWRVWTAAEQHPTPDSSATEKVPRSSFKPRAFAWQPLPAPLSEQLDRHCGLSNSPLPTIAETPSPTSTAALATEDASRVAAAVPTRHLFCLQSLRSLWDARPPPPDAPHLGLGADAVALPYPRTSSLAPTERAQYYRALHSRWSPAGPDEPEETVAAALSPLSD